MQRQRWIEQTLSERFELLHLEVVNESSGHNVPAGSESHFKIVLVSPLFAGKPLLARHRLVNEAMAPQFRQGLHALAMHTYTEEEWRKRFGAAPLSPPCHGGRAAE